MYHVTASFETDSRTLAEQSQKQLQAALNTLNTQRPADDGNGLEGLAVAETSEWLAGAPPIEPPEPEPEADVYVCEDCGCDVTGEPINCTSCGNSICEDCMDFVSGHCQDCEYED